jgi:uncharacterized protein involved in exopolysaccharide biosynthesis
MVDLNQSAPENNMRDMLQTVWRSKIIIIAVALLATAVAMANYYITTPKYKALSVIMVKPSMKDKLVKDGDDSVTEYTLPTSVELLKSYPLSENTVDLLMNSEHHDNLELFGNRQTKGKSAKPISADPKKTRDYAEALQHRITADNIRGTNLIEVSVVSPYADEAALLTNTLCEVFQSKNAEWSASQDLSVSKTIEQQITAQEQKVNETETALRDFMKSNQVYEASGNVASLQQAYSLASSEFDANRVQYEILRKQLAFIDQSLSEAERTFGRNLYMNIGNQLRSMRENIKAKENNFIALNVQKGANDPEVQAARADLMNLKTQFDQVNRTKIAGEIANASSTQKYRFDVLASKLQLNVRLAELNNSAQEYQRLKNQYQAQLSMLPAKQITYAKLSLDNAVANKTYAFLKEKLDESRIKAASNVGGVVIIKKAYAPHIPESPNLLQNLAMGLGGGLVLGFMIALLKEKMV